MMLLKKTFVPVLFLSMSALAQAQAPIVRQDPTYPPAQSQQAPDGQYPQAAPGQYPQGQPQQYPQGQPQQYPQGGPQQYPQGQYPQGGQGAPQQAYPPAAPPPAADQAPPPPMAPQQLDRLVNRVALYPDPLLAQMLTASTFWDEMADAASWANQHAYLHGDALSQAIQTDNLPWDPSVLALLPFPSVLDMMARDPNWTAQLGTAVLSQRGDVMDAVQRLRHQARGYGYLASNPDIDVVDQGGYIEIQPFNPYLYYVPVYDPFVVFAAPRPGFVVGGAIRFGPAVTLGVSFGRFGWFGSGFGWHDHAVLIDHRPWVRTYVNRGAYVHPYARPYARPAAPRIERHEEERRR